MQGKLITIGAAAALLGVSQSLLRKWDRQGRLVPERTVKGHRRYPLDEVTRIAHRTAPLAKQQEGRWQQVCDACFYVGRVEELDIHYCERSCEVVFRWGNNMDEEWHCYPDYLHRALQLLTTYWQQSGHDEA